MFFILKLNFRPDPDADKEPESLAGGDNIAFFEMMSLVPSSFSGPVG